VTRTYRIRVELADRPGALAAIAGAISAQAADVTSIDIHQPVSGRAVDEILVDAPDDTSLGALGQALDELDGVRVLHLQEDDRTGDAIVNALRWSRLMLTTGTEGSELELTRAMLEVSRAAVAWVLPVAAARLQPVGRRALDEGGPAVDAVAELPAGVTVEPAGPFALAAIPDDATSPRAVGFAARPAAVPFSPTELDRLRSLLALHRQVESILGRAAHRVRDPALRT